VYQEGLLCLIRIPALHLEEVQTWNLVAVKLNLEEFCIPKSIQNVPIYEGYVASTYGGAISSHKNCSVTFYENTVVMFSDNAAQDGEGAVYSDDFSEISYDVNTNVTSLSSFNNL